MFKVAGRVLDFYDDPQFIAHNATRDLDLIPLEKVGSLTDRDFAVKIATAHGDVRRWPVYNKTATALSGRYFCEVADGLPEDLRNAAGYFLKRAHLRHDLPLPHGLAEAFPRPESGYVHLKQEPEVTPLDSEFLAKSAQEDFLFAMSRMSPRERFERANKLFKIAAVTGIDLDDRIWDYVEKEKHGPFLRDELRNRHTLVKEGTNQHLADSFLEIMANVINAGPEAITTTLETFDKMAGLDAQYDDGLKDPFLAVYGGLSMEKLGARDEDIRAWKLKTLATKGRELEKIFEPAFVSKFVNDPEKTLAEAGTVEKRIINHMLNRLPITGVGHVKRYLLETKPTKARMGLGEKLKEVDRDLAGAPRDPKPGMWADED
jgi:hypothetical protein